MSIFGRRIIHACSLRFRINTTLGRSLTSRLAWFSSSFGERFPIVVVGGGQRGGH